MKKFERESDEVLYVKDEFVSLSKQDWTDLKKAALLNPRKRIRVCTHPDKNAVVQEMFIIHTPDCYVRPHKHLGKPESFSVLEGLVDLVLFDDAGEVGQVIRLGDAQSEHPFYFRTEAPIFHTLIIRSEFLIFHEITQGPFDREKTVFAEWSKADVDMTGLQTEEVSSIVKKMRC